MKSIDRLRRYVDCHDKITGLTATCINHLIDSIDKEVDDMWHALTIDAKPMTDENMAEDGWVRLPLDADGVPIHVGERVQLIGNDPSTVSHMSLAGDGWRVYVKYDGDLGTGSGEPSRIRHHHAPTVESVLAEMLDAWGELPSNVTNEAIIAKYAAKLQLKED